MRDALPIEIDRLMPKKYLNLNCSVFVIVVSAVIYLVALVIVIGSSYC